MTAMSRDKKGKGIRIRKKEADITTFTASQLECRPTGKQESVTVTVDGVEYAGVSIVRLSASWEQTVVRTFPITLSAPLEDS